MIYSFDYDQFWDNLDSIDQSLIQSYKIFLKEENRSSTIFPVFKDSNVTTSIKFLSYWLKKHGNYVVICLTTRRVDGEQIQKTYQIITEYKSYQFQISDYFSDLKDGFCGSVEVEVYSKNKPLYTFPAITICYEGNASISLVHSCIRIYNKNETVSDYAIMYPQTGFDTNLNNKNKNYICFFGGNSPTYNLRIELFEGDFSNSYDLEMTNNSYGQMHLIWLEDLISNPDIELLKNPKVVIHHDLQDVFPRFYVGILNEGHPPTLTHTFFDTSKAERLVTASRLSLRASNPDNSFYFDSAFTVPLFPSDSFDTSLRTYGQNLSFHGDALLTVYTMQGEVIYSRKFSQVEIKKLNDFSDINFSKILKEANIEADQYYSIKIAFINSETPFPKRFKMSLNVKRITEELGTNICFAPLVVSENTFAKPFNRRWFPVGGSQNYVAIVHNTSLERIELSSNTSCDFEFVNHRGETLLKHFDIKCNGGILLDVSQDNDLNEFLGNRGGWCMVTSMSYLTDAYYFSLLDKQIAGDHAY